MLALPGSAYLYQGEELGLPEVEDLPDELRQDPMFAAVRRRRPRAATAAGCRCRGRATQPPFGFSPAGAARAAVAAAAGRLGGVHRRGPGGRPRTRCCRSTARALRCRRAEPGLGDGPMTWLDSPDGVLAFARGDGFACVVNLAAEPAVLPAHDGVLLASGPLADGLLPTDTAVWLRLR